MHDRGPTHGRSRGRTRATSERAPGDEPAGPRAADRLRSILANTRDWIWEMDVEGRHTYSNHQLEEILGYTEEEFSRLDFLELLHPDDGAEVRARLPRLIDRREGWSSWVVRWRHRDGGYRFLESHASPVLDERGELVGFTGVDRDITARRAVEEQLRRSQKLEAIGRLSAGIAHDFNNLLTAILVNVALLRRERAATDLDDRADHRLAEIQLAGDRATELTRQLLAFGQRRSAEDAVQSLNVVVEGLRVVFQRLIGDDIRVGFAFDPTDPHVSLPRSELEQLLMNLVLNARDAMPDGGQLDITTSVVELEPGRAEELGLHAGRHVVLSVGDTGTGMDTETRACLFEPFFSTKSDGHGTGLGLATVYGHVTRAGGQIEVESAPERGSTFRVLLPEARAVPADEAPTGTAAPAAVPRARILLCEDDPAVRAVTRDALEVGGHEVLEAAGPVEALALVAADPGPIDLLVSDVSMPGMDGPELVRSLQASGISPAVLLISGCAPGVLETRTDVDAELLDKPFDPGQLLERVARLLAARVPLASGPPVTPSSTAGPPPRPPAPGPRR